MNAVRPKYSYVAETLAQNQALNGPSEICSKRGVLAIFEDWNDVA